MEQSPRMDVNDVTEWLDMLKRVLLGANVLLFVAAAFVYATTQKASAPTASILAATTAQDSTPSTAASTKRALLVIAHPDDESMFFLPLVHSLTQKRKAATITTEPEWELHLLCLSRGNFDGLGDTREREMRTCSAFLGIAASNVHVLEDPALQDGMQTQWSHAHIAQLVLAYMDTHAIDAVFTFDDYGVSGHANHIATHFGVAHAVAAQHARCIDDESTTKTDNEDKNRTVANPTASVKAWALESTNLVRKYIGICDAIVSSWLLGQDDALVLLVQPQWNYRAMALHTSQFVWYRRLFVVFSRFTFVNTFTPIGAAATGDDAKKTQ